MIIKFALTLIISLLNIFLGIFIYKKNSKNASNIFYSGLCITGGLWALFMAFLLIVKDLNILENVNKGAFIFGVLPPLFYLLFAYNFPYKLKVYSKKIIYLIFLVSTVLFILILFGIIKMETIEVINGKVIRSSIFYDYLIYTVYFFGYVLWGFAILLKKFFKDSGIYKQQIKYLIIATISTFIFTGTVSIILILFNIFNYDWLGPIFTLIHFIVVGYLIFYKSPKEI